MFGYEGVNKAFLLTLAEGFLENHKNRGRN